MSFTKTITIRIKLPEPTKIMYVKPLVDTIQKIVRKETGRSAEVYYD